MPTETRYPLTYICRHGETAWNLERRLQGQRDIPINETGRGQADANGRRLASMDEDWARFRFVCSPLSRTRETMDRMRSAMALPQSEAGTKTEPETEIDERLREISFGEWEGHTLQELEIAEPGVTERRDADKWHYMPHGRSAENYAMLQQRLEPVFEELARSGRPTVMVTHGGVIRCIFRIVSGVDPNEAAALDIPQDRILKLEGRSLDWI